MNFRPCGIYFLLVSYFRTQFNTDKVVYNMLHLHEMLKQYQKKKGFFFINASGHEKSRNHFI